MNNIINECSNEMYEIAKSVNEILYDLDIPPGDIMVTPEGSVTFGWYDEEDISFFLLDIDRGEEITYIYSNRGELIEDSAYLEDFDFDTLVEYINSILL